MLQVELLSSTDVEKASATFHRDGFVAIKDALTPEQLRFAQEGTRRVIREQTEAISAEDANRGFARYSFGNQIHHPEWAMLADLPTTIPILDRIWNSQEYRCLGGGGDYSVPGAKIQPLHSDIAEFLHDPTGQITFMDVPTPFIVINFLMVDFSVENGAIRFVPCTHRHRVRPPQLNQEPEWMRNSQLCAPAGTAVIRDVRCWHAGTANNSDEIRPMVSTGYYAPWFRQPGEEKKMPREIYNTLSERGQKLCASIVKD